MDLKINKLLTPYNYSDGSLERIRYIVIHYVGALGDAEANCRYYAGKYIGASAHYFVGFKGQIWQSVEDHHIAWHCGAKKYIHPECRNSNSIGIELCVRNKGSQAADSKDWYFEDATVETAIKLTNALMEQYGIDADHVIRHYDVTGKTCPNPYCFNHTNHTWQQFKAALGSEIIQVTPGWKKDTKGRYQYLQEDNTYAANRWLPINHHWYLFGRDSYMLTGWQKWSTPKQTAGSGDWYFLDDTTDGPLEGACWHSRDNGAMEIWWVD